MPEKILITGGEGFIGRNLRSLLVNEGHVVRTLDVEGKPDYHMSVTDHDSLMGIEEHFDGIFHLAATTSPPQFEDDPVGGFSVNANGTLNVLEFARRRGIRRVVMASSSSVYGDSREISTESRVPDKYANLYPVTKMLDEYLGRYYSMRGETECIALRYFNTFGSGENSKGMYSSQISKFIEYAMAGDPIIIYGDGTQRRDFIYVKDNVRATWLAYLRGRPGESYNIGTGISRDFNSIAELVRRTVGSNSEIRHIPNPLRSYQMFTQADMGKTRRDLGFTPEYDLERAIGEMVAQRSQE
jgi:UDP-glucose 4-epimerase